MNIRPIKISYDRLPIQMAKNPRILCTKELQKKLYSVFNEDNMTALQNYAEKENARIYFSYMADDLFHNTEMTVFKDNSLNRYQIALKICTDTKDDFVNSLRSIYNFASEAIKKLHNKNQ